jgi:hypothetical protein
MPTIPQGIIDTILHPPIGVLQPFLDYFGPYSGVQTLTQWSSTAGPIYTPLPVGDTYGAIVQLNGPIPIGWGFTNGWFSPDGQYDEAIYENRLLQFVVQHQFLGGTWVTTQMVEIVSIPTVVLWSEAIPGRIGLLAAPGLSFDLFYLLVG